MTEPYTKREMDLKFEGLHTVLIEHGKVHEEILIEAKNHNGRMKKLELWKAGLAGGMGVLTLIVVPLLFLVLNL